MNLNKFRRYIIHRWDTGKQDYIEGYVDPFPKALDKAGYKIVPKDMICHW